MACFSRKKAQEAQEWPARLGVLVWEVWGFLFLFGVCVVLWLCSLICGFGTSAGSGRGANVEWRGGKIRCELLIMNFVVAWGGKEGCLLSEYLTLGSGLLIISSDELNRCCVFIYGRF